MKTTQKIKHDLAKAGRPKRIPDDHWLSLGVPLLNIAATGQADRGCAKGKYIWYVGDSSSGKTWFCMTLLAEAARNPNFANHQFIYDDVEHGALMEVGDYFGQKLYDRLIPPRGTQSKPEYSHYVQDFYYNLDDWMKSGRPFIYVLDSMDSLDTRQDEKKFLAEKAVARGDKEQEAGSYGMALASINSKTIKRFVSRLEESGSILVVVNQTRANVKTNPYAHGPEKRPGSGGYALRFYAHLQLWTSIKHDLIRTVMGKKREYGKQLIVDIQKNRFSGWEGKIEVPFLRKHGFDATGASVDYLCDEGHWKKDKSGIVTALDFSFKGRREDLIKKIESENREGKLEFLTQALWRKIDLATRIKRKKRYE